jgi:HTH-type transcriptional regulator / antitoxin HigA
MEKYELTIPALRLTSKEQREIYLKKLFELQDKTKPTAEDEDYIRMLEERLYAYDHPHITRRKGTPLQILRFLMQQHGLKQSDLTDALGDPPNVSTVLNGKRKIGLASAKRLGRKFNVDFSLFL